MPKPTSPSKPLPATQPTPATQPIPATRPIPAMRLTARPTQNESLSGCYQCGKCSTGCPVASMADVLPHRIIRLVQLGLTREPLGSEHIWNCTGCGTCSTRCPNQIPVAQLMDHLKAEALASLVPLGADAAKIAQFHVLFNKSVCKYGRQYELGTVRKLKSSRELLGQFKLGMKMLRRGKLRLRPTRIRDRKEVRELFRRAGVTK
jgi:heterodisulfide reductase subunit C2